MSLLDRTPGPLQEVELQLEELEARVVPGCRLWLREWAGSSVRGCLAEIEEFRSSDTYGIRKARVTKVIERLVSRFATLKERLDDMDREQFGPLQDKLRARSYHRADFEADLAALAPYERDAFTLKLLGIDWHPDRTTERPRDQVYYEASSVAATLDVLDQVQPGDVLYDLGCGLGIVLLLAAWLTDAASIRGVEYEPAYVETARERAAYFGFDRVDVVCADAQTVDYRDGTIFYFFHPFGGETLAKVLESLRQISLQRKLRICARGACRHYFLDEPWMTLVRELPSGVRIFET